MRAVREKGVLEEMAFALGFEGCTDLDGLGCLLRSYDLIPWSVVHRAGVDKQGRDGMPSTVWKADRGEEGRGRGSTKGGAMWQWSR